MNPTFDGIELVDCAAAELLAGPQCRTFHECLPDVAGEFLQVNPQGGRQVIIRGIMTSTVQTSPELAGSDLKARIGDRQAMVGSVADYHGLSEQAHPSSLLLSLEQTGTVRICRAGEGFQALAGVEARILTQP